jgi:hypothetical protein
MAVFHFYSPRDGWLTSSWEQGEVPSRDRSFCGPFEHLNSAHYHRRLTNNLKWNHANRISFRHNKQVLRSSQILFTIFTVYCRLEWCPEVTKNYNFKFNSTAPEKYSNLQAQKKLQETSLTKWMFDQTQPWQWLFFPTDQFVTSKALAQNQFDEGWWHSNEH